MGAKALRMGSGSAVDNTHRVEAAASEGGLIQRKSDDEVIQRLVVTRSMMSIVRTARKLWVKDSDFPTALKKLEELMAKELYSDSLKDEIRYLFVKGPETTIDEYPEGFDFTATTQGDELMLNNFGHDGDVFDTDIREERNPDYLEYAKYGMQEYRLPNVTSDEKTFETSGGGKFDKVQYTTGNSGEINFEDPVNKKVLIKKKRWYDTHWNGSFGYSAVNLTDHPKIGTKKGQKQIDKKNRGQHFGIADYLLAEREGETRTVAKGKKNEKEVPVARNIALARAGNWTWHHLATPYNMVLVDMMVHSKYGHNGGVFIW